MPAATSQQPSPPPPNPPPPELRDYLLRHADMLQKMQNDAAERASRLLVLVNGGGAIAALSFMAQQSAREAGAWVALGSFVAGIVFCLLLAARNYHVSTNLFSTWVNGIDEVLLGTRQLTELAAAFNNRAKRRTWIATAFGYAAALCFLIGAGYGIRVAQIVAATHAAVTTAITQPAPQCGVGTRTTVVAPAPVVPSAKDSKPPGSR